MFQEKLYILERIARQLQDTNSSSIKIHYHQIYYQRLFAIFIHIIIHAFPVLSTSSFHIFPLSSVSITNKFLGAPRSTRNFSHCDVENSGSIKIYSFINTIHECSKEHYYCPTFLSKAMENERENSHFCGRSNADSKSSGSWASSTWQHVSHKNSTQPVFSKLRFCTFLGTFFEKK